MISNKQLNMWKKTWDTFISDEVFRDYFTNRPSYDLVLSNNKPITNNRGTLYIPPKRKNGEGHFIAYEMKGPSMIIFDPSAYAYQQFSNNPALAVSLENRSGKRVIKLDKHPQDFCPGDTFCQTWSIAWLKASMRRLTDVKSMTGAINSLHRIVYTISHNQKFIAYMMNPPNRKKFNSIIRNYAKDFSIPESNSQIDNVKEFVKFSQTITKKDIARIMLNRT